MPGTVARVRKDADTLVCIGRWSVNDISAFQAGLDTLDRPQFCVQDR